MRENSYSVRKRFEHVREVIRARSPRNVLDFGCGTGAALTAPLAAEFPQARFHGVEAHPETLELARRDHSALSNLAFSASCPDGQTFDMVIASEVIEHVPDGPGLLREIHRKLEPGGTLILTLPNGNGPFEWMSFAESLLRWGKRVLLGAKQPAALPSGGHQTETLAISPHIRFYGYKYVLEMVRLAGFRVDSYRGRSFLCGMFVSPILDRSPSLLEWNNRMADILPPRLLSSWIFVCTKGEAIHAFPCPEESLIHRWKRSLNLLNSRRWV